MKRIFLIINMMLLSAPVLWAQQHYKFSPGFDPRECDDLLRLNFAFLDTTRGNQFKDFQTGYEFKYRSPGMGLDNVWDLWIRADSTVVILLRGTTADPKSILADFYCAMVPAKGKIVLPHHDTISYQLASDERAAVHAGFLIGFAYLSKDIAPRLDSLYQKGYHDYLISGHSQGGALAYYVSAWMLYLKKNGKYPLLNVKTYASASPKMGNMYFAYDYDNITHAEWAFSIVNSTDPVPEMPFTTQQVDADMNEPNPILNLIKRIDHLPLLKRIVLKHAFKKMIKKAAKSSRAYQKYLGGYASAFIKKMLPGLTIPKAVNTTYFVRPGVPISLVTNENYFNYFKVNDGPYYHHGIIPYRYLLRQYYHGLDDMTKEEVEKFMKSAISR
jgi:hypothetical protein